MRRDHQNRFRTTKSTEDFLARFRKVLRQFVVLQGQHRRTMSYKEDRKAFLCHFEEVLKN